MEMMLLRVSVVRGSYHSSRTHQTCNGGTTNRPNHIPVGNGLWRYATGKPVRSELIIIVVTYDRPLYYCVNLKDESTKCIPQSDR